MIMLFGATEHLRVERKSLDAIGHFYTPPARKRYREQYQADQVKSHQIIDLYPPAWIDLIRLVSRATLDHGFVSHTYPIPEVIGPRTRCHFQYAFCITARHKPYV